MITYNYDVIERYVHKEFINPNNYWIFDSIIEGKQLYEIVDDINRDKIKKLYDRVKNIELVDLLLNKPVINTIYGSIIDKLTTCINFIVGAPDPYDAFVRDHGNTPEIIIDINRLIQYGFDDDKTIKIIKSFITHELIHVANRYIISHSSNSKYDELLWMTFDEGIAHYLSFNDDILHYNWESSDLLQHKEINKKRFEEITNSGIISNDILEEGCSGKYWNKFASIYGMFLFSDILDGKRTIPSMSALITQLESKLNIIKRINLTIAST